MGDGPLSPDAGRVPPPLTPPHKGEGNDFDTVAIARVKVGIWLVQQSSPPPCGEGLGVGVFKRNALDWLDAVNKKGKQCARRL